MAGAKQSPGLAESRAFPVFKEQRILSLTKEVLHIMMGFSMFFYSMGRRRSESEASFAALFTPMDTDGHGWTGGQGGLRGQLHEPAICFWHLVREWDILRE
jgi:hypothetical protein